MSHFHLLMASCVKYVIFSCIMHVIHSCHAFLLFWRPLPCLKRKFRLLKVDSYIKNAVLNEDIYVPLNISLCSCYTYSETNFDFFSTFYTYTHPKIVFRPLQLVAYFFARTILEFSKIGGAGIAWSV